MTLKLSAIAAALAFAFTVSAQAQQTPSTAPAAKSEVKRPASDRKVKDQEEERIEQQAKADKAACDGMKDNAKDVCMQEAKVKEKVAKAELDAKHNPSARNQRKVAEVKAEGEYEVAKEKCDDQKGDAKNKCEKDAKAKHEQAKADIKKQYAAKADRPKEERRAGAGSTAK